MESPVGCLGSLPDQQEPSQRRRPRTTLTRERWLLPLFQELNRQDAKCAKDLLNQEDFASLASSRLLFLKVCDPACGCASCATTPA